MGEFRDVVRAQRACRAFAPRPVPDEVLGDVLESATFAPSAENRQPWVFVVVRDPEIRRQIGELNRRAWEGGARRYSEGRLPERMLADVDDGAQGAVARAPVIVVVCGDTAAGHPRALPASVFPAVQNLLLAAGAAGLGSALTTLPLAFADEMSAMLELPGHVVPMAVVPIGWPERRLGPPRREPLSSKAHRDHFGVPW